MSALVERLRNVAAADEIERLTAERDAWEKRAGVYMDERDALLADAERMQFLHDHCSVSFVFKRADGSTGSLHGPSDIRAAIDAVRKA